MLIVKTNLLATMWEKDDNSQIEWLIKMMSNEGFNLDLSISSLIEIDRFFQLNYTNGKLLRRSKFRKHFLSDYVIIHSLNLYIENILKKTHAVEEITQYDEILNHAIYGLKVGNLEVYTEQMLIKRAHYGFSHALYPYYYELTKEYLNEDFQEYFFEIQKLKPIKTWWQLW